MWHVLEHVHDLNGYLEKYYSILKQEGRLIIAVPNYTSYDAFKYQQYWAAYDVPIHLWHFSKTAIKSLFQKQDLELIKVLPMKFDAFYVSLLSEEKSKWVPSVITTRHLLNRMGDLEILCIIINIY